MFGKVLGRSAVVVAALVAIAPANAMSFVFAGSSGTAYNGLNTRNFNATSGTTTVSVTAWSVNNLTSTTAPVQAYLGLYDHGLGVTTQTEGNGGSNSHQIDNVGQYDFVRLVFSEAVNLTGLTRYGFDMDGLSSTAIDTDAWVSYSSDGTSSLTASTLQGYASRGASVSNTANPSNTTAFSKVWLVGASRSATERNDGFKLSGLTAVTAPPPPAVPEPATWLMMILGFGAIGTVVRQQARLKARIKAFMAVALGRKLLTGPANA